MQPEDVEALLAWMVSVDTVNPAYGGRPGGEVELATGLEARATRWGFTARRFPLPDGRFNLLIAHAPNPGGSWLLCESHLDTVATTGMTVPPLQLTRRGSRLHGRGACDTKGSGAAMLAALQLAARSGQTQRNLGVLFTIDEESGMTGARTLAAEVLPRWSGPIEAIIVGEPTGLQPVVSHNGVIRWTTVAHGRAAHSSDPSRGQSAISTLVRVVAELEARYVPAVAARTDRLTGAAACSINVIRGGAQVNIVPARAEIEVDRRMIPGETAESVLAERDALLAGIQPPLPGRIEHLPALCIPPLPAAANLRFLETIAPEFARLGLAATPTGARYATNASYYGAAGIPALVLGPGDIAQAHTADEWLDRAQLARAVQLYSALMLR
ncbi:M20/M25/M40 family metallo-hydrolase [Opitutus sp. ER46]|uniref:M20/M25/M40 family metallo-hydrolase n=1 Tax=Opitutus sp. ER46 TaxID=2161864 RepID=UPI000D30DD7C|nr:M20/M25/M40 family metallo-hydrolase [Opitutus sp. ER46]PTX94461.1 hypothetical protein DB354_12005 [Opitutus sp. ER46]